MKAVPLRFDPPYERPRGAMTGYGCERPLMPQLERVRVQLPNGTYAIETRWRQDDQAVPGSAQPDEAPE